MRTCCPSCQSVAFVRNGFNQHGDQNHKCLECGRQFVLNPQNKIISDETREFIFATTMIFNREKKPLNLPPTLKEL